MPPKSLYIHVPFCARRCFYCDFAVEAMRSPPTDEWLEAIGRELGLVAAEQRWAARLQLETLYVGGGTPSLLSPSAMEQLRLAIAPHATLTAGVEWTCEANPESLTAEVARGWAEAGVNRISIGAQTFHEPTLRWMGRLHGAGGPGSAVATARTAGIDNLSLDLIFGLPEHLGRDLDDDLDKLLALEPQHISLYGLTAEAGAPLGRWVREGREALPDEDRYADEYLRASTRLVDAGFEHYEVSNFARPGRRSRHNARYWTGEPYAALGPGSHAFYPPERRWNIRRWTEYRDAVVADGLPVEDVERVGSPERKLESIWLGLRTSDGLPIQDLDERQKTIVSDWERRGWASVDHEGLRLTTTGWLLLDQLAVDLAPGSGGTGREGGRIDAAPSLVHISD